MNTITTAQKALRKQSLSIDALQASLRAWEDHIDSMCVKYCIHRSQLTTEPHTGNRVCMYCGKS